MKKGTEEREEKEEKKESFQYNFNHNKQQKSSVRQFLLTGFHVLSIVT